MVITWGCRVAPQKGEMNCSSLNLLHLEHLYSDIMLNNGNTGGIIHIYSEFPDYNYTIEPDEGFTCVDDVARAIVLLCKCENDNGAYLDKMAEFLVSMQSENGYFHNFIWHDGSINKTYKTSVAVPDWWSWRAFWALEEYAALNNSNAQRVEQACELLVRNIYRDILDIDPITLEISGFTVPSWLPYKTAADQAGVLILGLEKYYLRTGDAQALVLMDQLAEGLIMMQAGDSLHFPYGAFLSWNNLWHAYGNMQSYALLRASDVLDRPDILEKALLELDHFYPWLVEQGFMNYFLLLKKNDTITITESSRFPQIAYGIRPMIYACTEAYRLTGKSYYKDLAAEIADWLTDTSLRGFSMFDPGTGRCYDGIINQQEVNMNSGAESTIEALLSLQALENSGIDISSKGNE